MNHKANIGLVNPHPKGDGCHNDVDFFHQEIILVFDPLGGFQTGMVRNGLDIVGPQNFGKFFGFLAA